MINFRTFMSLGVAALTLAATLGTTTQARAAFTLTLAESGGATVTVTDGGSGDVSGAAGVITYSGGLGDFIVQVTTGSSNAPGGPTAQLTINNLSITSTGGDHTLTVTLTDDGFTAPVGPTAMESQLSSTMLPQGSTVTFQSFLNGNGGTQLGLNAVGGVRVVDSVNISGPFTLQNVTTYTVHGAGTIQTTGITTVAPAPQGMLLALTAIPALGVVGWFYRRRQAGVSLPVAA